MTSSRESTGTWSAVARRHLLTLFEARSLDGLIDATFVALRAAVHCDFASVLYRQVGGGLLKERDSRGRTYDGAFMRRYAELTPARALARAQPGVRLLRTAFGPAASAAGLRDTPFYREVMQPQGWRHAVALCCWGEPLGDLPVFVASVNRAEGRRDFSTRDVRMLDGLHPFIDCAVNRLLEREHSATVRDGMVRAAADKVNGFAILDNRLRLLEANQVAGRLSAAWEFNERAERPRMSNAAPAVRQGTWRLPALIASECAALQLEWRTLVGRNPDVRGVRRRRVVAHPTIPGLTVRITMVSAHAPRLSDPTFVLELDSYVADLSPARSATLPVLQSLTVNEKAVVLVLADGLSNQEIADRLGKSLSAVKFLLHRVYQKTGLSSRAALVARVAVPPSHGDSD